MTFGTHTSSGDSATANVTGSITGAPPLLTLKSFGYDDDETEWIPIGPFVAILQSSCGTNVVELDKPEGQNDCGEWTSGSASFNLDALAEGVPDPENFTKPFTIQAHPQGGDSEVSFDLNGTFGVTYVP